MHQLANKKSLIISLYLLPITMSCICRSKQLFLGNHSELDTRSYEPFFFLTMTDSNNPTVFTFPLE
jgi:hypothetical protein